MVGLKQELEGELSGDSHAETKKSFLPSVSHPVNPQATRLFIIFSEGLCIVTIITILQMANSQLRKLGILVLSQASEVCQGQDMNQV